MNVLPICMYEYSMHARCLRRPEAGIGYPETRVLDAREPLCECREQNSGPLQDTKCSFLIAEPSLYLDGTELLISIKPIFKEKGGTQKEKFTLRDYSWRNPAEKQTKEPLF